MNRNSFFLIAVLSTSLFCCMAQNNIVSHHDSPHTLLWKISGKNLSKPSYLFGTMHILCADDALLSEGLKKVVTNSDEIYFEIDLSDMKGMMNSLKYLRMNNETTLSDLLDSEEYAKVRSYFVKHVPAVPFGMLERFKPMLVSSMLEEQSMDCKTPDGMEMEIMKAANSIHKKINGLESVEFQAQLFDSIPYKKQAADLLSYIDSADENSKSVDSLVKVYKEQDLDKIDELTRKDDITINDYVDLLLNRRNQNWVKKMNLLMPVKSLLFAVGAAHLPGEYGVIALLRREGYQVTPLKN
jgi:uncharacterized protein